MNKSESLTTKECLICKETKEISNFRPRKDRLGKHFPYCKPCEAKKNLENQRKRAALRPKIPKVMSPEARAKISKARSEYLKANPDKHPWRRKDHNKSVPCEKMREYLTNKGINFVSEYPSPIEGRFFSIDIAIPDKKIIIEVNGTQHYNRDGTLKPYYQERHDLLEAAGWTVYEFYYANCYHLDKLETMFQIVSGANTVAKFDYANYVPMEKGVQHDAHLKVCPKCRGVKTVEGKMCIKCNNKILKEKTRKVDRPTREKLLELIKDNAITKIGRMYGVTGNSIRKWCASYNIPYKKRK